MSHTPRCAQGPGRMVHVAPMRNTAKKHAPARPPQPPTAGSRVGPGAAWGRWRGLLRRETGPARQALRALLTGRLVFTPEERDGEAVYAFAGEGTVAPMIAGATGAATGGVSPAGFEPALPP
jgi:hypothetical protein